MGLLRDISSRSFRGVPNRWMAALLSEPRFGELTMERMNWDEICRHDDFRGRWVALDDCRYDEGSGRAVEGMVVDSDDDLVELCSRIQQSEYTNCEILFCNEDGSQQPASGAKPLDDEDDEDPFPNTAH